MRIERSAVVMTMSRSESKRMADDLNTIANHLAKVLANAGEIDTGHPLAELSDAAHRIDEFRMDIEEMIRG